MVASSLASLATHIYTKKNAHISPSRLRPRTFVTHYADFHVHVFKHCFKHCFQHTFRPGLTIEQHLRFYANIKGVDEAERAAAIDTLIHDIGLWEAHVAGKKSSELSGGMRRRLSLGTWYSRFRVKLYQHLLKSFKNHFITMVGGFCVTRYPHQCQHTDNKHVMISRSPYHVV